MCAVQLRDPRSYKNPALAKLSLRCTPGVRLACMLLVAQPWTYAQEAGRWHPGPARNNVSETFAFHVDYKTDLCGIAPLILNATQSATATANHQSRYALRDALRGMTISTGWPSAATHYPTGLMKQDQTTGAITGGAMVVLFDELAKRAGFEWRTAYGIVSTDASAYTTHQNKTWDDLIVWTTHAYDVAIDWWIETPERLAKGIFYPRGWFDASLVLVGHKDGTHGDGWVGLVFSWARPFSPALWALVVLAWVAAGIVYWLIEDGTLDGIARNDKEFVYPKNWQNLLLSVFNTSLEYAGAKWHHPQTFAGRLFSFGWLFARALLAGKILNSQP